MQGGAVICALGVPQAMMVHQITEEECRAVLTRGSIGRLGCSQADQPYIMPILYVYEADDYVYQADCIYVFSTFGRKIEWMRTNPKVCVQVDEIHSHSRWVSVIATGTYEELPEDSAESTHARRLLEKERYWWLNALAERRVRGDDMLIDPLFFRVHLHSITGLRATDDK